MTIDYLLLVKIAVAILGFYYNFAWSSHNSHHENFFLVDWCYHSDVILCGITGMWLLSWKEWKQHKSPKRSNYPFWEHGADTHKAGLAHGTDLDRNDRRYGHWRICIIWSRGNTFVSEAGGLASNLALVKSDTVLPMICHCCYISS